MRVLAIDTALERLRQVELTVTLPNTEATLATTERRPEFRQPELAAQRMPPPPETLGPVDGVALKPPSP